MIRSGKMVRGGKRCWETERYRETLKKYWEKLKIFESFINAFGICSDMSRNQEIFLSFLQLSQKFYKTLREAMKNTERCEKTLKNFESYIKASDRRLDASRNPERL